MMPFLITGCMYEEEQHSSLLDIMRQEDNQTRHFRPVHIHHPEWSINQLSKTITLRTGTEQIKVSTRHHSNHPEVIFHETFIETIKSILPVWNHNNNTYMVVRKDGYIIAYVQPVNDKIEVFAALSSNLEPSPQNKLIFQCESSKDLAMITTPLKTIYYSIHDDEISNKTLTIKPLSSRRRFSIANKNTPADDATCKGQELESPFNMLGTMIFHSNEVPLPGRTALAWYLTVTNTTCR